jgi:hypothetical protein
MVADVDGGPCLFCAACGAWCTTKPVNLKEPCGGRDGRGSAGTAALRRFREGYVPDCGESRDRRVHAVEPLYAGAKEMWNTFPLPRRSGVLAQYFLDRSVERAASLPPPSSWNELREKAKYLVQACRAPSLPPGS